MRVFRINLFTATLALALLMAAPAWATFEFNGQADNTLDIQYAAITGGLFPTGDIPNGDNASGGTFRYLLDEPLWGGYPLGQWNKDDWFPANAGLAMTLMMGDATVYDNNGLEDGSGAWFYDYYEVPPENWTRNVPGLYMGTSMVNNWDWIYATYFKLEQETTFDTIIGYFNGDGMGGNFDPHAAGIGYLFNIWSSYQDLPGTRPSSYMPAVASFLGDVFNSLEAAGAISISDTGVDRVFPYAVYGDYTDDIWRVKIVLAQPLTLPAGVYFFNHSMMVAKPLNLAVKPGCGQGCKVNLCSNGKLPVAVYGGQDLDVADLDADNLIFAGARPVHWAYQQLNDDQYPDLILQFQTSDLILEEGEVEAVLRGLTTSGDPVWGTAVLNTFCPGNRFGAKR